MPVLGIIPDAVDLVYTLAEKPFGKSSWLDVGLGVAGVVGTLAPFGPDEAVAAAKAAEQTAKLRSLSSVERKALMAEKLEANAGRRLGEMQDARLGAHFDIHGAKTTIDDQLLRASKGINPITKEVEYIPSSATRFFSNVDQMNAINRTELIFVRTGDKALAQEPIQFGRVIGDGYQRGALNYATSMSARSVINTQTGLVKTSYPIWGK